MSDECIDLPSALRRCTGSTAEAEQSRRRMASELAAHLMQRVFRGQLEEPELVESALATLLGDSDPRLNYAPAWTIASLDRVVDYLARGAMQGDPRQIVENLRECSRTTADLIKRNVPNSSELETELPDSELW